MTGAIHKVYYVQLTLKLAIVSIDLVRKFGATECTLTNM